MFCGMWTLCDMQTSVHDTRFIVRSLQFRYFRSVGALTP